MSSIEQLGRIGNYRVVRKLGEGGMGAVYEVVRDDIGRRAALKVLKPELAQNPQIAARFLNEARASNVIDHPGVVKVFELDRLPDSTTYIIMELISGESLRARLDRSGGRLEHGMLRLAQQVASALAAAHAAGIIHRDLKPDNVMLCPDPAVPGGERARLLDFGIAKLSDAAAGGGDHQRTHTGAMMGTPTYMSPEQCRGAGAVEARTDVYALGVMFFEMLAGKPPFVAQGMGELIAMHMFTPPPRLAERVAGIPAELEALVQAMLAKDAAARPTMSDVAQQLDQLSLRLGGSLSDAGFARASGPVSQASLAPTPLQLSTLGQAAGQVAAQSQPGAGGKGGKVGLALPLGIAGALLVAGGVGYFVLARGPAAKPIEAPPKDPIADVDAAARKQAQAAYGRFEAAAAAGDVVETLRIYGELPSASPLRESGKARYQQALSQFARDHLGRAEAARKAGRCDDMRDEAAQVLAIEPAHAEAQKMTARTCPDRHAGSTKPRKDEEAAAGGPAGSAPVVAARPEPKLAAGAWFQSVNGTYSGRVDRDQVVTRLLVSGGHVSGSYTIQDKSGTTAGQLGPCDTATEGTMSCRWRDKFGQGKLRVKFSGDRRSFSGTWGANDNESGSGRWSGERH